MSSFELLKEVGMKGSAFKYYDEESDWKGGRIFVDIRTVMQHQRRPPSRGNLLADRAISKKSQEQKAIHQNDDCQDDVGGDRRCEV